MTALEIFGQWVAGLEAGHMPLGARCAARFQVMNMLAASYAAAGSDGCQAVLAGLLATHGEGGRATVFATGHRLPPVAAAMANAAFSMAQDYDDIIWTGHTGHSAAFAAWAVAEQEGGSLPDLLTAVVAANEVAGRLAASAYLGPLNGQMVNSVHLVGAAAAASKLLRLDAGQTTHALAIALSQPPFLLQPAFFGPGSKLLTASVPLAMGIQAAYWAREGLTGAPGLVEDPKGFWRHFTYQPFPALLEGLGEFWTTETLAIKTYPGCFYFQTACTALERLLSRHPGLTFEQVAALRIDTTKFGVEVTRFGAEYASSDVVRAVDIDFDMTWVAAILLHAGRFTAHEHDEAWLAMEFPALRQWREKIVVRHDPALTLQVLAGARQLPNARKALRSLNLGQIIALIRRYRADYRSNLLSVRELAGWWRAWQKSAPTAAEPGTLPLYFPNRVTLVRPDGTRDSEEVALPVGTFCAPGAEREVRHKFRREAAGVLDAAQTDKACRALLYDSAMPVEQLARLCAPN